MQRLVYRASEINRLNQNLLIDTYHIRYEDNEWYFTAVVEVEKLKKKSEIESPGKFVYSECDKWDKSVKKFLYESSTLEESLWIYVIRRDDAPVTIMFNDIAYDMDPEDCCINATPMTGAVFKIDNVEVHKFLKSLTQGTKA